MQFIPPLNIGVAVIDRVLEILDRVFSKAEKKFGMR
jgi:hypothetical protein